MTEPRRALITGITGQDGSYLAELLLQKGYEVHGLVRRVSTTNTQRIDHLLTGFGGPQVTLHTGDLMDSSSLERVVQTAAPQEVYHLAAQSHVHVSFQQPIYTVDVTGLGTLRLLEAVRGLSKQQEVRFYQASSSEMFGHAREVPQSETTPFHPRSPYACAKVYSFHQTVNYREAYGLYACNGILFNHESPRRGEGFVTRKITRAAGRIAAGLQEKLYLGNLDAQRDWGYAGDYVDAMWRMLQQPEPRDYVIATNSTHTVREFLELTFARAGLDVETHVELDPALLRPSEVPLLKGDYSHAKADLGWEPTTTFTELVERMTDADLDLARLEAATAS